MKWKTQVSWTDKSLGKQHEPQLAGEKRTLKKKLSQHKVTNINIILSAHEGLKYHKNSSKTLLHQCGLWTTFWARCSPAEIISTLFLQRELFFYTALQCKEHNLILRIPQHFVTALHVNDIGRLRYFQKITAEMCEIMQMYICFWEKWSDP